MKKRFRWLIPAGVLAFLLSIFAYQQPASATLNIVLNYTGSAASEPTNDPGGTNLMLMMNAAAEHWGRAKGIIQDNHSILIDISYTNLSDTPGPNGGTILGLHTPQLIDGSGRQIKAMIQMDSTLNGVNRNWFFDPTPTDDTEFNMLLTRYGSLGAAAQTAGFIGSPPNLLEVGFQGGATLAGGAQGTIDMFSVALHEMGHALGMTGNVLGASFETIDGDYDVNPNFVDGATMAILASSGSDLVHLADNNTLMFPGIGTGTRILPSATDVFAVATSPLIQWSSIDLHRSDFLGGTIFNDPAQWIGGQTPNPTMDAFVRSFGGGGFTVIQTGMQFQDLNIFDGWSVTALANSITVEVFGTTRINGANNPAGQTRFVVQGGSGITDAALLDTDSVFLSFGGRLKLDGPDLIKAGVFVETTFDIDGPSSLFGQGLVRFTNDQPTDRFINRGTIEADGNELRLFATNNINPVWDLDGDDPANPGGIEAINGDISVSGLHVDAFKGLLKVGAEHRASFDHTWTLDPLGDVFLDGGTGVRQEATLGGADVILQGPVLINKQGRIGRGPSDLATFDGTGAATVDVNIPDADDILFLDGPAIFMGGTYRGDGTIVQNSDITVDRDTTIDVAIYQWGNSAPGSPNTTTVKFSDDFIINSPTTGTTNNSYSGIMTLEGGRLTVNTTAPWTIPDLGTNPDTARGVLNLHHESGVHPIVKGQPVTIAGDLKSRFGLGIVEPNLTLAPTGKIDVGRDAVLRLSGPDNIFDGGLIEGEGTLYQNGNITVTTDTLVNTTTFDWGNSQTNSPTPDLRINVNTSVLFEVNSHDTGPNTPTNEYRGSINVNGGELRVNINSLWTLPAVQLLVPAGTLNLFDSGIAAIPTVSGSATLHVLGHITVDASQANINATTIFDGGSDIQFNNVDNILNFSDFQFVDTTFNHTTISTKLKTVAPSASLEWVGTTDLQIAGQAGGALTFDLHATTDVVIDPTDVPRMTIQSGATVNVAGSLDPFTSTSNSSLHVSVINNSTTSFNINAGKINLASLDGTGNTRVGSGASLIADSAKQNLIRISSNATLAIRLANSTITTTQTMNPGLVIDGTLDVSDGDLSIFGTVQHNNKIKVKSLLTLTFKDDVTGPGIFTGLGTTVFEAGYSPGASPAEVDFDGNIILGGTHLLTLELAGSGGVAGIDFDQLDVNNTATINPGATLDVTLFGGFTPSTGDVYPILMAGDLNGTFDNEVLPDGYVWSVDYNSTTLSLEVLALLGDMNADDNITTADAPLFIQALVNPSGYAAAFPLLDGGVIGDMNQDGTFDLGDIAGFNALFAGPASAAAVPEPTTLSLAIVLLMGIAIRLRRRG